MVFMGMGMVFSLFYDRLKQTQRTVAEVLAGSRYQAQLEPVFHAIQDGIVVTDMEGAFLLVNKTEARTHGFPTAEAMKQNLAFYRELYELSYPEGKPLPFEEWPINRVLKGESITNLELRARRREPGKSGYLVSAENLCAMSRANKSWLCWEPATSPNRDEPRSRCARARIGSGSSSRTPPSVSPVSLPMGVSWRSTNGCARSSATQERNC